MSKLYTSSFGPMIYLSLYATAIVAVLFCHTLIHLILSASLIVIPIAWVLRSQETLTQDMQRSKACLTIWCFQSISFIWFFILVALWFTQFPPNHFSSKPNFAEHPSLSLIFSSFLLSSLLTMLCILTRHRQQPISIFLFFPTQKKLHYLGNWGNVCFFKAILIPSLLLLIFSCQIILAHSTINETAVLISILLIGMALRLPWVYKILQIMIKRWHINFLSFILISVALMIPMSIFIHWMMKPFGTFTVLNFSSIAHTTPSLIFWGLAISLTIPIAFSIAPKILHLTPRSIFLFSLTNPLLWLLLVSDYHYHLLNRIENIAVTHQNMLAFCALLLSLFWLRSIAFAKRITLFFGNLHPYQDAIPRNLVLRSLYLLFFLMLASLLHAAFIFQIEFLLTGAGVLISCIIAFYLFFFRVPYES